MKEDKPEQMNKDHAKVLTDNILEKAIEEMIKQIMNNVIKWLLNKLNMHNIINWLIRNDNSKMKTYKRKILVFENTFNESK